MEANLEVVRTSGRRITRGAEMEDAHAKAYTGRARERDEKPDRQGDGDA
jgi:hypothetical protein